MKCLAPSSSSSGPPARWPSPRLSHRPRDEEGVKGFSAFHKGCLPPPAEIQSVPVNNAPPLSPDAILQTAFGFWGSKVLLTAVEFGLFTTLGTRHLTGPQLGGELGLHPRAV